MHKLDKTPYMQHKKNNNTICPAQQEHRGKLYHDTQEHGGESGKNLDC